MISRNQSPKIIEDISTEDQSILTYVRGALLFAIKIDCLFVIGKKSFPVVPGLPYSLLSEEKKTRFEIIYRILYRFLSIRSYFIIVRVRRCIRFTPRNISDFNCILRTFHCLISVVCVCNRIEMKQTFSCYTTASKLTFELKNLINESIEKTHNREIQSDRFHFLFSAQNKQTKQII